MNKSIYFAASCITFFSATSTQATDHAAPLLDPKTQIRGVIASIQQGNARHSKRLPPKHFQAFADKQTPRATVVTCADSRVHENDFHPSPDNDLFMVRNIGNQMATAEGSIEYGVRHLHTPLLLIVGHAVCGAIKAATGDYASIEPAIKTELNTLRVPKGMDVTDGVLLNVNQQVDTAMRKYSPEISDGKLAVMGAYYDFRNDLKMGYGKLIITNINGTTDPDSIQSLLRSGKLLSHGGR